MVMEEDLPRPMALGSPIVPSLAGRLISGYEIVDEDHQAGLLAPWSSRFFCLPAPVVWNSGVI